MNIFLHKCIKSPAEEFIDWWKDIQIRRWLEDSPDKGIIKRLNQQRYTRKMQRENSSGHSIKLRDLSIQRLGKCHDSEDA